MPSRNPASTKKYCRETKYLVFPGCEISSLASGFNYFCYPFACIWGDHPIWFAHLFVSTFAINVPLRVLFKQHLQRIKITDVLHPVFATLIFSMATLRHNLKSSSRGLTFSYRNVLKCLAIPYGFLASEISRHWFRSPHLQCVVKGLHVFYRSLGDNNQPWHHQPLNQVPGSPSS